MIQQNRLRDTPQEAWEGNSIAASIPMDLKCTTLLVGRRVHQSGSSPNPVSWGFL